MGYLTSPIGEMRMVKMSLGNVPRRFCEYLVRWYMCHLISVKKSRKVSFAIANHRALETAILPLAAGVWDGSRFGISPVSCCRNACRKAPGGSDSVRSFFIMATVPPVPPLNRRKRQTRWPSCPPLEATRLSRAYHEPTD